MLSRRALTAALPAALGLAGLAKADPVLPPLGDPAADQAADIRAGRDAVQRMTIKVMIGDAGPFRFVVDTGADRSVVADDIAAGLGLESGPDVMVHGIAGAELTPTLRAPPLMVGSLRLKTGVLPVLRRARLGADGMLGVDVLQGRRLVMDISKRVLRIRQSTPFETQLGGDEMVIRAMKRYGRLAVVNAIADRVDVTTFIDSGAELSVGNTALAARLTRDADLADAPTLLFGVTEKPATGFVRPVRMLKMGGVEFSDVPLVFSDLHLFDLWGLKGRPAVLLGMDVLQLFSRVELDYGERQILFQLADGSTPLPALQLAQG